MPLHLLLFKYILFILSSMNLLCILRHGLFSPELTYLIIFMAILNKSGAGVPVSVSEIVNSTYSYGYTDPVLFKSLQIKLKRFYETTNHIKESEETIQKGSKLPRGTSRASSNFRFRAGFSRPRIDEDLKEEIRKYGEHTLPTTINMPQPRDVYKSDTDCIQRYAEISKNIKRSNLKLFVLAGIHAAKHMNLIVSQGDSKFSPEDTITAVEKISKNTNSGYPFFSAKSNINNKKDTVRWVKSILDEGTSFRLFRNSLMSNPEAIFNRFQPALDDSLKVLDFKIRQVWCVPQRIVALEQVFFGEMLDYHKFRQSNSLDPVVTSGLSNKGISTRCVKRIRDYMGKHRANGFRMYSLDYSKFDSSIPDFAIDIFFSICRTQLDLTEKQSKIFDLLRFYTKRSPFIYCGSYGFQNRGISSGSLITSTFDSWWNLTLWYLARTISHCYEHDVQKISEQGVDIIDRVAETGYEELTYIKLKGIVVCGDDVLFASRSSVIESHRLICDYLGMKCTVYKSIEDLADSTFFLGRYWDSQNRPYQTEEYITAHLISRTKWYKKNEVDFDISEMLDIYRILSICLPLHNGRDYITKYLRDYRPLTNFLADDRVAGFPLLKDWHSESDPFIPRDKLGNWSAF